MLPGIRGLLGRPRAPLVALALVSVLSLAARAFMLGEPCQSPCRTGAEHTLIFDEAYYVNAARVIDGIRPAPGAHYADAPLGTDPNAEHPQLAKLIMAGAIRLFGDGPFAWRIGSLIFGSIAILGMYGLTRAAGGGPWTAVTAAALMAADNLLLVHGRIGTLDIYVVAMMVWAMALYLRGRVAWAGLALGIGTAFKMVAPYLAPALVLLELGRWITRLRDPSSPEAWRLWPAVRRLVACLLLGALVFTVAVAIMDQIATPYADATSQLITSPWPFAHIDHMIVYAEQLVSPHGPQGIASYPWDWLIDLKPIVYLQINPSEPGNGLYGIHPVSRFLGMMNPSIMLLELPALALGLWRLLRPLRHRVGTGSQAIAGRTQEPASLVADDLQLALLGPAWFLGTWLPFALLAALDQRTSYLYYMVIVMPGIYVADAYLASRLWRLGRRWISVALVVWGVTVLVAAIVMYPFDPLFI